MSWETKRSMNIEIETGRVKETERERDWREKYSCKMGCYGTRWILELHRAWITICTSA